MRAKKEGLKKIKERAEEKGFGNVSNDAAFIVSELKDIRNLLLMIMLPLGFAILGILIKFGLAILASLPSS